MPTNHLNEKAGHDQKHRKANHFHDKEEHTG